MSGDSPGPARFLRRSALDLVAVGGVLLAVWTVTVFAASWPLRPAVTVPFVLLVPGYAIVAALFPERSDSAGRSDDGERRRRRATRIDGIERLVLSLATSIAVVTVTGVVLDFTPWQIRFRPVATVTSVLTLLGVVVAAYRRWNLPERERFVLPAPGSLFDGSDDADRSWRGRFGLANVAVLMALLLTISSVAAVVTTPRGETFTEFTLLTEGDDGQLTADGYPERVTRGEKLPLAVSVTNRENEQMSYTVVVQLQRVDSGGSVTERVRLNRFRLTVVDGETVTVRKPVVPTITGERLRLSYLLYRTDPPAEPTRENAYREVHLWLTVSPDE